MLAENINAPSFGKVLEVFNKNNAHAKNLENHLSVCIGAGLDPDQTLAPLMGYCPGRPPKHGVLALHKSCIIFCQKTRVGEAFMQINISQISALQVSRLLKQNLITLHCAGLNFQFATRVSQDSVSYFLSHLNKRMKTESSQ